MRKPITQRLTLSLMTLLLVFSVLTAAFSSTASYAAPLRQTPKVDNPYGVNLLLDSEVEPWKKERTFYLAAKANIKWVKQEFAWDELEFSKGNFTDTKNNKSAWEKYDELVTDAEKFGLTMVARLDRTPQWARGEGTSPQTPPTNTADYADFVAAFLTHYQGRIKYIQIWNEPNLQAEWNTGNPVNAAEYVALLKAAYERAKSVDPSVQVLSAPLAINLIKRGDADTRALNDLDYWREMYTAGAKGTFDIASANTYGLRDIPTADPSPEVLNYRRVELLHQIMADNGDGDKSIWFNEYGWNANPGPPTVSAEEQIKYGQVTPQQQAQYTVDGINYARANWPWAGVIFIWYMRQEGLRFQPGDSQYYFALVNVDFTVNPIYNAVASAAAAFPGPNEKGNLPEPIAPPAGTTVPEVVLPTPTIGGGGGVIADTPTPPGADTPTPLPIVATDTPTSLLTPTTLAITPTVAITPTRAISTTATPVTTSGSSGDNNLLLIILGVLAAAAIVVGVLLFMRRSSNDVGRPSEP